MKITLVLLGRASEIAGGGVYSVELEEGSKLRDLVRVIGEKISPVLAERYSMGHYIFVFHVNGVPVDNLDYPLKNGDRVTLITPEMGG